MSNQAYYADREILGAFRTEHDCIELGHASGALDWPAANPDNGSLSVMFDIKMSVHFLSANIVKSVEYLAN